MIPRCLTIAGSDPSGGAGIQADLKVFSALGTYGMSVITALTAQNTQGVSDIFPVTAAFVGKQYQAIYEDINIDAVKIGMLMNREIVEKVAELLHDYPVKNIILDTVMIAKSGHHLLDDNAIIAIRDLLIPQSSLITPNLPEAAALLGEQEANNETMMILQGKKLLTLGCKAVLMKGGHLAGEYCPDLLITEDKIIRYMSNRIHTKNTHGTGCSLSSAIAALLPKYELESAVKYACEYLHQAIVQADHLNVGKGKGPTHHFALSAPIDLHKLNTIEISVLST